MAQKILALDQDRAEEPPLRVTFEEFLAFGDEDTWAEWVNGEILLLSPVSKIHQRLSVFLTAIFACFVEAVDSGIILTPAYPMKLSRSAREPDLLFISKERLHLSQENYMDGPADLVVEIVSPESRKRDRVQKLKEYEEGGVREYWLLDPMPDILPRLKP
jgi:Uma2 family endonuclease